MFVFYGYWSLKSVTVHYKMQHSVTDNGQCIPIKCEVGGVPPIECTRLCALRHYVPTCNTPGDFCLCQHLVGNSVELVSPDEVLDQPPDDTFSIFALISPLASYFSQSPKPSPEPIIVNVNEGQLFWNFHYILSGLLLLMLSLVIYELIMCRVQYYGVPEDEEPKKNVFSA